VIDLSRFYKPQKVMRYSATERYGGNGVSPHNQHDTWDNHTPRQSAADRRVAASWHALGVELTGYLKHRARPDATLASAAIVSAESRLLATFQELEQARTTNPKGLWQRK
jgi:hypothetical protein